MSFEKHRFAPTERSWPVFCFARTIWPDSKEGSTPRRLVTMSYRHRHSVQLTSLALGVVLLVGGAPFAAGASVNSPTTSSVLAAAKKAMSKESGVHVKVTSTNGTDTSNVVVDIGAKYGAETIQDGAKKVSIIVTPTAAYLSGTKTGLTQIMGLTAPEEKKVGSLSIVMKAGTTPYQSFAANLTTSVLPTILPALKGTTFSVGSGSKKNYLLTWKTAATSSAGATKNVFTISSGKKTLPVKEVVTSKGGGGSTTFTKWGEDVTESAPAGSSTIAYAKVIAK
jgi:hypothetical protein